MTGGSGEKSPVGDESDGSGLVPDPGAPLRGLAGALARGRQAREAWVEEGVLVSREHLAKHWNVPITDLAEMVAKGELFELEAGGAMWLPAAYLGVPIAVVAEVNRALSGVDAATAFLFWNRNHGALGGRTVNRALMHDATLTHVEELAKVYSQQLAAG